MSSQPVPDFSGEHTTMGFPLAIYEYRDALKTLRFYNCCYLDGESEVFQAWTFTGNAWVSRMPSESSLPLYGAELLEEHPTSAVIVVDNEGVANALRRTLNPKANVVVSWANGFAGFGQFLWTALEHRTVNIWPTASDECWKVAGRIGALLFGLRATVSIIDTHGQAAGWNARGAIQQGMSAADLLAFAKAHKKPIERGQVVSLVFPSRPAREEPPDADVLPAGGSGGVTNSEIWQQWGLEVDSGGRQCWANLDNVNRVVRRHPDYCMRLWFDQFSFNTMLDEEVWTEEVDTHDLVLLLQRKVKLHKASPTVVSDAVRGYARTRGRHPVREHLEALNWDGTTRIDTWLHDCFGTPQTRYAAAVGRIWLVGMVARVMKPGCQMRTMVVLEGAQNQGKTKACRILGGRWHAELTSSMSSKDFFGELAGKWLVEISELQSFHASTANSIKTAVSRQDDYWREPYARRATPHPRQCVMVGTTNQSQWHTDETGGTRFLPVACTQVDDGWLTVNRDQLMAEAVARFKAGQDWHTLPSDEAKAAIDERYLEDPWESTLAIWVAGQQEVSIGTCLDYLDLKPEVRQPQHSRRIGGILRHLGWRPGKARRGQAVVTVFRPEPRVSGPSDPGDDR